MYRVIVSVLSIFKELGKLRYEHAGRIQKNSTAGLCTVSSAVRRHWLNKTEPAREVHFVNKCLPCQTRFFILEKTVSRKEPEMIHSEGNAARHRIQVALNEDSVWRRCVSWSCSNALLFRTRTLTVSGKKPCFTFGLFLPLRRYH